MPETKISLKMKPGLLGGGYFLTCKAEETLDVDSQGLGAHR